MVVFCVAMFALSNRTTHRFRFDRYRFVYMYVCMHARGFRNVFDCAIVFVYCFVDGLKQLVQMSVECCCSNVCDFISPNRYAFTYVWMKMQIVIFFIWKWFMRVCWCFVEVCLICNMLREICTWECVIKGLRVVLINRPFENLFYKLNIQFIPCNFQHIIEKFK